MRYYLLLTVFLFSISANGQKSDSTKIDDQNNALISWLRNLNESGLEVSEDSLKIGEEFLKMLNDSVYRASIYPETYTWEQTVNYIQAMDLKKAIWFLINLYPENETNKKLVVQSIMAYDQLFKMDKLLINTFYTYSFLDPRISEIHNGTPEIVRPDILEDKLRNVKEIVNYIYYYRPKLDSLKQKNQTAPQKDSQYAKEPGSSIKTIETRN